MCLARCIAHRNSLLTYTWSSLRRSAACSLSAPSSTVLDPRLAARGRATEQPPGVEAPPLPGAAAAHRAEPALVTSHGTGAAAMARAQPRSAGAGLAGGRLHEGFQRARVVGRKARAARRDAGLHAGRRRAD